MEIAVKNMVCDRCVMVVREIMARLGYPDAEVTLGLVKVDGELSPDSLGRLADELAGAGFELLRDASLALVERVKAAVIDLVRGADDGRLKLSAYLTASLNVDYRVAAAAFARVEGRTIERYYITQKVEYVKELLDYGELTVSEIADMTGYSSVAHLSHQFRAETGMTPSAYKLTGHRRPLDKV